VRRRGGRWVRHDPVLAKKHFGAFVAVAAGPKTGVFAAGWQSDGRGLRPLLLAWHGSRWRPQRLPGPFTTDTVLTGLVNHKGTTWAVGYQVAESELLPVLFRRDNDGWSRVPATLDSGSFLPDDIVFSGGRPLLVNPSTDRALATSSATPSSVAIRAASAARGPASLGRPDVTSVRARDVNARALERPSGSSLDRFLEDLAGPVGAAGLRQRSSQPDRDRQPTIAIRHRIDSAARLLGKDGGSLAVSGESCRRGPRLQDVDVSRDPGARLLRQSAPRLHGLFIRAVGGGERASALGRTGRFEECRDSLEVRPGEDEMPRDEGGALELRGPGHLGKIAQRSSQQAVRLLAPQWRHHLDDGVANKDVPHIDAVGAIPTRDRDKVGLLCLIQGGIRGGIS
jgi:hypothetical protein